MFVHLKRFVRDELGSTAVEYSVVAGSIAVLLVASVGAIGIKITSWFQSAADAM